jgi:hypothetical protein
MATNTERVREYRERKRKLGLCSSCPAKAAPGRKRCDACNEKGKMIKAAKAAAGLCQRCGVNKVTDYPSGCNQCQEKTRVRMRALQGCKPRVPGGVGRPIKAKETS